MKSKVFLIALLFVTTSLFSQSSSINYKALIKDGGGNVVANQNITVQFQILQGVGMSLVYQETRSPNTDNNGIVILNIGEGTPDSGDYSIIDWGSDDHYLNVQINTGGGLTDMGTTQFMAVPYALRAANVEGAAFKSASGLTKNINLSDDFLVGSSQLNDDGDINHDSRMFFDKTLAAFRAGRVEDLQWDNSNVGSNSFAAGFNNIASGTSSFAIGSSTNASGLYSFASGHLSTASGNWSTVFGNSLTASADYAIAMGRGSEASGENAMAMGNNTIASGNVSTAMGIDNIASAEGSTAMGLATVASGNYATSLGFETDAESYGSVALGRYNDGGGTADSWVATDKLFEVGIGTSNANRANALTVLKNGYVGIGTSVPIYNLDIYSSGGIGARVNMTGAATTTKYGSYINVLNTGDFQQFGTYNNVQGNGNANHHGTFNNMGGDGSGTKYGTYNSLNGDGDDNHYGYYSTVIGSGSGAHIGYNSNMIANGIGPNFGIRNVLSGPGTGNKYGTRNYIDPLAGGTHYGIYSDVLKPGSFAGYFLGSVAIGTTFSDLYTLPASRGNNGDIMQTNGSGNVSWTSVVSSTGLETLDEGNGIGWRLIGRDPLNYGNIGLNAVDLSYNSFSDITKGALGSNSIATGNGTSASGSVSTAMGWETIASGSYSTATGVTTSASGTSSTAMGSGSTASGFNSMAMGSSTDASGDYGTSMGQNTQAESYASTAIGSYNIGGGSADSWIGTDPLFEIGNGSFGNRNNAFTILKNANVGIGVSSPSARLDVASSSNAYVIRADNPSATGNNFGIYSNVNSNVGTAIYGKGYTGIFGLSESSHANGLGVYGLADGSSGQGVTGKATGESGKAIYGEATGQYGKGIHVKVTSTHSSANGILAESGGGSSYAGYFVGKVHIAGVLSKSSGSFKIDHPLDPENKYLSHSFVESPDMMNIYNGNIVTDKAGNAIVVLPDYFEALNMEYRYQLTVIGEFAQAIISEKIEANTFKIKTDKPNIEVSWQVTGVRNDAFARKNRIKVEEEKETENIGTYLNPEVFSKNASKENATEE